MDQPVVVNEGPLVARYPPPPYLHWGWLAIGAVALDALVRVFVPLPLQGFVETLGGGAWGIYLCLWIRELDPKAKSIFWWSACIFLSLIGELFDVAHLESRLGSYPGDAISLCEVAVFIVSVFVIRNELQEHYNKREPIGLHLGLLMTLFFSFLYFQYHLFEIAKFKKRQAAGVVENVSRTLLS